MLYPLLASVQTVAQAEPSSSLIDFKSALLIIVTLTLYVVTRKLIGLNHRIERLESNPPFPVGEASEKTVHDDTIAPETVAAISAAVHTTLRSRLRILTVGQVCPHRQAWSLEGRRQVFHSHDVR